MSGSVPIRQSHRATPAAAPATRRLPLSSAGARTGARPSSNGSSTSRASCPASANDPDAGPAGGGCRATRFSAVIVHLLEITASLRVGNDRPRQSLAVPFGLTTLRAQHAEPTRWPDRRRCGWSAGARVRPRPASPGDRAAPDLRTDSFNASTPTATTTSLETWCPAVSGRHITASDFRTGPGRHSTPCARPRQHR